MVFADVLQLHNTSEYKGFVRCHEFKSHARPWYKMLFLFQYVKEHIVPTLKDAVECSAATFPYDWGGGET